MRHTIILFTCLLAMTTFGHAQEVFVSESHSIRNDDAYAIIGKIDQHVLLFVDKADSYEIRAYDEEMKEAWTKDIELDSKRAKILNVTESERDFTIIYQYNKRGRTLTQAIKFDGNAEVLTSDTVRVEANRGFYSTKGEEVSENKRYILLYEIEMSERVHATVFDMQSMKRVWTKVFMLKDVDIDRDFVQILVDNSARAYFVFSKDNRKAKREENRFYIVTYDHETALAKETEISMQGYVWFDVAFKYDNINDRLVGAGLYMDKRYAETNGHFFLGVDIDNTEAHQLHFQPFEQKFITRSLGKEANKKRGIGEVSVRDLILRQDGGVLMTVERNRFYSRTPGSLGTIYTPDRDMFVRMDFHLEDILLFAIHPDGKLHWNDVLQKRQFSQDDGARFSSYLLMHTPRQLRFIYNDEIRYKTIINEYLVGGTGNTERNSLYNSEEHDVSLLLREAKQVAANEAIIASERRSNLKLVRMVY